MNHTLDLSKQAPRSPRIRLRGYAIMARTIDKCVASLSNSLGDFHFDCPLDNMLFGFKKIVGDDFKQAVINAESDEDVALWVDQAGIHKTEGEIEEWSNGIENYHPYEDPERRDWFVGECGPLGLDPKTTTLFDYLEADDRASFSK